MALSPRRAKPPTRILVTALAVTVIWLGCSTDETDLTGPDEISVLQQGLKPAINVQERNNERLFAIEGVVGTAVGLTGDGQPVIKVYTAEAGVRDVPRSLENFPVEVVVTGVFVALDQAVDPTQRFPRPVPIGVSTGHPDITAGTIGARVKDDAGNVYALSNNHVYAVSNEAKIGDNVIQPGTFDDGSDPADKIGQLFDFEPIKFNGGKNEMDAAIAISSLDELGAATPIDGYGAPATNLAAAFVGQIVKKYGRTTGLTEGQVAEVNVTVDVCYEGFIFCRKLARFANQVGVTPGSFSDGGDSGSLIVTDDGTNRAVALLFAGSDTRTIASPIGPVLARFNVTMDDGSGSEPPPDPVTDVAVSQVSAPASATKGDDVPVDVTVQNVGTEDVTADIVVTLDDQTDGGQIGQQTIVGGLAAGASTTLNFTWSTASASVGQHTLTASHGFADDDASNDQGSTVVSIEDPAAPVTDVAVTQVSAPASATQGDVLSIDVTVENVGTEDVAADITVSLNDDTDGVHIGDQTIAGGLAAGASTTLTFTWDTDGASTGDHTLSAVHDVTDDDGSNDQATATVTIEGVEPPAAGMHVGDLDALTSNEGRTWSAIVPVMVHDEAHNPVANATITGSWSPGFFAANECTTDADGDCLMLNTQIPKSVKGVTFTVISVSHSTLEYAAGANHDDDGDSDGNSIVVER